MIRFSLQKKNWGKIFANGQFSHGSGVQEVCFQLSFSPGGLRDLVGVRRQGMPQPQAWYDQVIMFWCQMSVFWQIMKGDLWYDSVSNFLLRGDFCKRTIFAWKWGAGALLSTLTSPVRPPQPSESSRARNVPASSLKQHSSLVFRSYATFSAKSLGTFRSPTFFWDEIFPNGQFSHGSGVKEVWFQLSFPTCGHSKRTSK